MQALTRVGHLLVAVALFAVAAPAVAYDEMAVEEKALRVLENLLPEQVETRDKAMEEAQVDGWVKASYEAKSRRGWLPVEIFVHEDADYALAGRLFSVAADAEPQEKARQALKERIPSKFERELIQDQPTSMEGLREYLFEIRIPKRGPQAVGVYVGDDFGVVGQLFGPANQNLTQKSKQAWRGTLASWDGLTEGLEPVYGEAGAPVRFAMFTDPDCPACQRAKKRIDKLMAKHGDRLAGYLLWLPLDAHEHAKPKAKVLSCSPVASQAQLFDALKGTKPNGVGEVYEIFQNKEVALPEGVRSCVESGKADQLLERFRSHADKVRLSSVPTVYFDGKVYNGFPEDAVKEALAEGSGS